jgi:hypothetical protein
MLSEGLECMDLRKEIDLNSRTANQNVMIREDPCG